MITARYPWVLHGVNIKIEHHFFFLMIVARYPLAIELYRNGKAAITKKRGLPNVASTVKKTVKKYNFEKLCIHIK
jgi:hypothetical protein